MRRTLGPALVALVAALSLPAQAQAVWPWPSPSPSPSPSAPATASPTPSPGTGPAPAAPPSQGQDQSQLIDQARALLGASMADGLAVQARVGQSLDQNAKGQDTLGTAVESAARESTRLTTEIAAREGRIQSTRKRIEADRRQIGALARAIYVQPDNLLVRVLRAGSLQRALVAGSDLTAAGGRASQLEDRLQTDLRQLDEAQRQQQDDLLRRQQVAATQATNLQRLRDLQGQQQQLSGQLTDLIARTNGELGRLDGRHPDLALRIAQQLQAEEAQLSATAERLVWEQVAIWQQDNPTFSVPSSADHSKSHRFIWPVPGGVVTQEFGPTGLAMEPAYAGFAHFHTGIDVAAPMGTPVLAADDGIVVVAVQGATGYGNHVVLAHDGGLTTLYGHLEQALVAQGQRVRQGQQIGLEGSTGASTGPHCHFEVRVDGRPVDPRGYLPAGAPSGYRG
jgi:murein DD-endopeptidase MepM/ murein hydrolase activator NlpD